MHTLRTFEIMSHKLWWHWLTGAIAERILQMQTDCKESLSADQLLKALTLTGIMGNIILHDLARGGLDTKGKIIRNFVARCNLSLASISALWALGAYQDCWVIFRCVVERLFHLHDLAEKDSFQAFEKWSITRQFELMNTIRSDKYFSSHMSAEGLSHMNSVAPQYRKAKESGSIYRHPKPKDVARQMDLLFLYKYGYDFASTQIHPMANDGEEAFLLQIGDTESPRHMDHRSVLRNVTLAHSLVIEEGLIATGHKWIPLISTFLHGVVKYLESGSEEYITTFDKLRSLGPEVNLSDRSYPG